MATVEKYIRKLLFEHDCVIIPEFGGILTHHIGAHFDAVNSVFLPARKRLAFNEVLKIDDGLLNYYVAANEKMTREAAANLVRGYVDQLRQQLLEDGEVVMDSIGVFSSNSEGKLVFEPDYSQNYNGEWFGLQELSVRTVSIGSAVDEEMAMQIEPETTLLATGQDQHTSTFSRNWLNWAAAAVFIGAVTLLSAISSNSENTSLLSTLNPFETVGELEFVKYPTTTEVAPLTKSAEKTILIPDHLSTTSVTKLPLKKSPQFEEVVYIPTSERQNKGKALAVNSTTEASVKSDYSKGIAETVNVKGDYFLIAGSFSRNKNAQILKGELIQKGFAGSSVIHNGAGRLINVSAGTFDSMEKALQFKGKVDAATGAESWVLHKK